LAIGYWAIGYWLLAIGFIPFPIPIPNLIGIGIGVAIGTYDPMFYLYSLFLTVHPLIRSLFLTHTLSMSHPLTIKIILFLEFIPANFD